MGKRQVCPTDTVKKEKVNAALFLFYSTKVFEVLFLKTIENLLQYTYSGPKGMTEVNNEVDLIHLSYIKCSCVKFALNLM